MSKEEIIIKDWGGYKVIGEFLKSKQIIDEVYRKYADSHWTPPSNPKGKLLSDQLFSVVPMEHSKESFINEIKTNPEFSEKWGLKIEERELSLEERYKLDHHFDCLIGEYPEHQITLDKRGVPRKLITITYNNETIESYEYNR
jgi:hypothetical protein